MTASRIKAARTRINWESRHQYEKEYRNTDEAEWAAFLNGRAHISQGTRDDMMSEAVFEQEGMLTPGDRYMEREGVEEGLQASVLEIIEERQSLLGVDGYPFALENNSLKFLGDNSHPYLAFLAICNLESLTRAPFNKVPVAFEYISLIAAQAYLGPASKGWRFGWPRDNEIDLRISAAASNLKSRAGNHQSEWDWNPKAYLPQEPTTRSLKDAGLDFVAWVGWKDRGPAQLQLVGQCACGEDWKLKTHDLTLPQLRQWMAVPEPAPIRALFTPRHTPFPSIQYKAAQAGLIFDRVRLVHMLTSDKRTKRKAAKFVDRIIALGKSQTV